MPLSSTPRGRKPKNAQRFTRRLLAWFDRHGRDLPWRRTRDPYRVLVSEFMLQQTQVSRVAEFYPRFLKRFSSLDQLARARPKAVREAWGGLGYYARASNLHALARVVRDHHQGKLPADPEDLETLPGVGRYTAGAVASFAYEKAVPAVDTNVGRVLSRVFFGKRATLKDSLTVAGNGNRLWHLAAALVPKDGKTAWRFNQAVMELGAVICRARRPKCPECPVRTECKTARRLGVSASA